MEDLNIEAEVTPLTDSCYEWFVELPTSALDVLVPEGAKWGSVALEDGEYDSDGLETKPPVTRQKTLREYLLWFQVSADGGKVIILLAAMQAPTHRLARVSLQDKQEWNLYLQQVFNLTLDAWFKRDRMFEKLRSTKYTGLESET